MSEDVLGIIALITGAVLIVGHLTRTRRAHLLQQTIREALRHDTDVAAALLDKIDEQPEKANSDDRTGLVLIAIGAALFGYALIRGEPQEFREIAGIALFPLFVGAVLVARHIFVAGRAERP